MANNFGFMPVIEGERYFISYKSDDAERVGEITRKLNEMGVPMWYDYGIQKGKIWEREINRHIRDSEAFVMFVTKALFSAKDTYVQKEFTLATMYGKKTYIVWLDDIDPFARPGDVVDDLKTWYVDVDKLQGIKVAGKSVDYIAWSIVTEFDLINGNKPQPPTHVYNIISSKKDLMKQDSSTQSSRNSDNKERLGSFKQLRENNTGRNKRTDHVETTEKNSKPILVMDKIRFANICIFAVVVVFGVYALFATNYIDKMKSTELKPLAELKSVSVGDHFTFGSYPQGTEGEIEPIEWRVLYMQDDKALVISEKLLDNVRYNETHSSVTWETCSLRKWMNDYFFHVAFSSSEQKKIVKVKIQNDNNPQYQTSGGNATNDSVFALSIDEAKALFSSNNNRIADSSSYNYSKRSDRQSNMIETWWLRTPGENNEKAVFVINGRILYKGDDVDYNFGSVRPAMWIKI